MLSITKSKRKRQYKCLQKEYKRYKECNLQQIINPQCFDHNPVISPKIAGKWSFKFGKSPVGFKNRRYQASSKSPFLQNNPHYYRSTTTNPFQYPHLSIQLKYIRNTSNNPTKRKSGGRARPHKRHNPPNLSQTSLNPVLTAQDVDINNDTENINPNLISSQLHVPHNMIELKVGCLNTNGRLLEKLSLLATFQEDMQLAILCLTDTRHNCRQKVQKKIVCLQQLPKDS